MSKQEFDFNWFGMLTIENVHEVADLLRKLLAKGRLHTLIESSEGWHFVPRVKTDQALVSDPTKHWGDDPIKSRVSADKTYAILTINGSYGLIRYSTDIQSLPAGEKIENTDAPYFSFTGMTATISNTPGNGYKAHRVLAIQKNPES